MTVALASSRTAITGDSDTVADQRLYTVLLNLESAARQKPSVDDLRFLVVNETHRLLGYFQCFTWTHSATGGIRITAVSGVSEIDHNALVVRAMAALVSDILKLPEHDRVMPIKPERLNPRTWLPIDRSPGHISSDRSL